MQNGLIESPLLDMFFDSQNVTEEQIKSYGKDGLEDLNPRLLEQVANSILQQKTLSYFDGFPSANTYHYESVRSHRIQSVLRLPMLFVAGTHDRLANASMIFRDGYLATQAPDKDFIAVDAGHLDVINGLNARDRVWLPTMAWMRQH